MDTFSLPVDLRQIVVHLQLQPAFRRAAKGLRQTHGHFRRDAGMPIEQQRQRLAADAQPGRGLGDCQIQRFEVQVTDDLAGVRGFFMGMAVNF